MKYRQVFKSFIVAAMTIGVLGGILFGRFGNNGVEKEQVNEKQVIMYNSFDSRLQIYDRQIEDIVDNISIGNGPVYSFSDLECPFYAYTNGKQGMGVLRLDTSHKKVEKIYSCKDKELYPLGYDTKAKIAYYVQCPVSAGYKEGDGVRDIVIIDSKGIKTVVKENVGKVTAGTILNGVLYVSHYDETKDLYKLMKVEEGKLIECTDTMKEEELYTINKHLIVASKTKLYGIDTSFSMEKPDITMFSNIHKCIFKMKIGKNDQPELTICNYQGDVVAEFQKFVGLGPMTKDNQMEIFYDGKEALVNL